MRSECAIRESLIFLKRIHVLPQDTHVFESTGTCKMPRTMAVLFFIKHLTCSDDHVTIVRTRWIQTWPRARSKWSSYRPPWSKKLLDRSLKECNDEDMQ